MSIRTQTDRTIATDKLIRRQWMEQKTWREVEGNNKNTKNDDSYLSSVVENMMKHKYNCNRIGALFSIKYWHML